MYPTQEQRNVLLELGATYGVASRCLLERTPEPYGIIRVEWWMGGPPPEISESSFAYPAEGWPVRSLFIKPDGTRLSWTSAP